MLNGITWNTYIAAVAIAVVAYYLVIGILYYRRELESLLSGKLKPKRIHPVSQSDNTEELEAQANLDALEDTVNNIQGILEQAGKEAGKEGLLYQINQVLASYDGLHQPAYRNALKNYIIKHAKDLCGVDIGEDELEEEWKRLPR